MEITYALSCVRQCSKDFIHEIASNPHHTLRQALLLFPFSNEETESQRC